MTDQVALSNADLHKLILRMSRREEGVGVQDVVLSRVGEKRARNHLDQLASEGKIHKALGGWSGKHFRWFASEAAATKYAQKPRHATPHTPQREIDRIVQTHGVPSRPVISQGIASGCDARRQCTPAEIARLKTTGEFSTRRPGVYIEAPASCAARAAK